MRTLLCGASYCADPLYEFHCAIFIVQLVHNSDAYINGGNDIASILKGWESLAL